MTTKTNIHGTHHARLRCPLAARHHGTTAAIMLQRRQQATRALHPRPQTHHGTAAEKRCREVKDKHGYTPLSCYRALYTSSQ
jgi:hypothetical protein